MKFRDDWKSAEYKNCAGARNGNDEIWISAAFITGVNMKSNNFIVLEILCENIMMIIMKCQKEIPGCATQFAICINEKKGKESRIRELTQFVLVTNWRRRSAGMVWLMIGSSFSIIKKRTAPAFSNGIGGYV